MDAILVSPCIGVESLLSKDQHQRRIPNSVRHVFEYFHHDEMPCQCVPAQVAQSCANRLPQGFICVLCTFYFTAG